MKELRNARIELETTTNAVVAAHEAYSRDAIESVGWERRGLLQRLARVGVAETQDEEPGVPVAA